MPGRRLRSQPTTASRMRAEPDIATTPFPAAASEPVGYRRARASCASRAEWAVVECPLLRRRERPAGRVGLGASAPGKARCVPPSQTVPNDAPDSGPACPETPAREAGVIHWDLGCHRLRGRCAHVHDDDVCPRASRPAVRTRLRCCLRSPNMPRGVERVRASGGLLHRAGEWSRRGDRVGVAVGDLPCLTLAAKDHRHAQ